MTSPATAAPSIAEPPASAALQFPFSAPPPTGTVTPIAEGLAWLRMPLPFALDHINLWLLRDADGWTIVDCGFGSDPTRAAWDAIFEHYSPITRVIATHYHPDHVGLAGWLTRRWHVDLWMTEAEYLTAHAVWEGVAGYGGDALERLFKSHGLDAEGVAAIGRRGNAYRRSVTELPMTFRRMTDGDRIRIGAHDWRVIVGYGHAPEHAALFCEELGILISGDMLLPKISTNTSVWSTEPEGDPVGQFLKSISRFTELPADTLVLPAHGLPFRGIDARVAALHQHHRDRLRELRDACRGAPKTAAEVLPVLFRRQLDSHQLYFAMGEAIAHLNRLLAEGAVTRSHGADGIHRFAATHI
jgi:glyoxylase-like metal-dependent hydrolase (beta-lactamase superfamily II)